MYGIVDRQWQSRLMDCAANLGSRKNGMVVEPTKVSTRPGSISTKLLSLTKGCAVSVGRLQWFVSWSTTTIYAVSENSSHYVFTSDYRHH